MSSSLALLSPPPPSMSPAASPKMKRLGSCRSTARRRTRTTKTTGTTRTTAASIRKISITRAKTTTNTIFLLSYAALGLAMSSATMIFLCVNNNTIILGLSTQQGFVSHHHHNRHANALLYRHNTHINPTHHHHLPRIHQHDTYASSSSLFSSTKTENKSLNDDDDDKYRGGDTAGEKRNGQNQVEYKMGEETKTPTMKIGGRLMDEYDDNNIDDDDNEVFFERLMKVDTTIRELQKQLPTLLSRPLTGSTACLVYDDGHDEGSSDNRHDNNNGNQVGGGSARKNFKLKVTASSTGNANREGDDDEEELVDVLSGRDELISLSDVLVVGTVAAGRANAALTGGRSDTSVKIDCQLILDDTFNVIRVPWTAKAPVLGSPNENVFDGLTDFVLSPTTGKVETIIMRRISWNKQPVAIGQAIKTIRSIGPWQRQQQQQQRLPGLEMPWKQLNELRDSVLEQAANAVVASQKSSEDDVDNDDVCLPQIYKVKSIGLVNKWYSPPSQDITKQRTKEGIPCPGTEEWVQYVSARECIRAFCCDIIPELSELSIVSPRLFSKDVKFCAEDGSIIMESPDRLSNFFQSMSLLRTGTFSTWKHSSFDVVDVWNRTVGVEYEVKSTLRQQEWTLKGKDIFYLDTTTTNEERPVITKIQQGKMTMITNNVETSIDSKWMMDNIVFALERQMEGGTGSVNVRDFFTEVIMSQPNLSSLFRGTKSDSNKASKKNKPTLRKLSSSSAANIFYIMEDLQEQGFALFDPFASGGLSPSSTSAGIPPALDYASDNIELKGYLGENIAVGKSLYRNGVGSLLLGIREAIRQKRLLVQGLEYPRVELQPRAMTGRIGGDHPVVRVISGVTFRITPPGAGMLPESLSSSPPIKIEITSDYKISSDTGLILEHKLVETRVNGQLTPGDQVSRWMRRFISTNDENKSSFSNPTNSGNDSSINGEALKAITDALLWLRSMNG